MSGRSAVLLTLLLVGVIEIADSVPEHHPSKIRVKRQDDSNAVGNSNNNFENQQPQEGDCICVPYYLCENNTIITNGVGLIDIRFKEELCADALEVCCKKPIEKKDTKYPPKIERRGCGFRNDQGIGFRITGYENEAQFGEFPWMIGLLMDKNGLFVYKCGASLLHPQVVMTAAHCVVNVEPSTLFARAGEWDTQTTNELYPHQQKRVKEIIIHEGYNSAALFNDIALILLEEPFQLDENVDTICLPKNPDDVPFSPNCFASGWGKDKFEKTGIYQVILKKVELPIVHRDDCENRLKGTRLGEYFKLHHTFVCAGGIPERDTCKGDGGSPLVCPIPGAPGRYLQTGIVAWGIGCGTDVPGVYVNVAQFREWVDYYMQRFNLQPEYVY
ncbi:phenoloxidase-activating factor 2-like [Lycorma delicatula]|uniref:phenoloxidase-activating factor 2-like n=1 Tax=Lycorma delicatula TaxID=130591 RepID=UPI003F510A4F